MYGICVEPVWSFCISRIPGFLTTTCEARLYRKFYGVVVAVPRGARTIAGISGRWSRLLLPHLETAMSTSTCPWNHGSNLHRPKCHLMPTSWGLGPLKITSVDVSEKNRSTVQKGVSCQQRFLYVSSHAYAMHPVFSWYFMARFENSPAAFVLQQSVVLGWKHDVCGLRRLAERVGNWWRMPEFENQPPNLFCDFL